MAKAVGTLAVVGVSETGPMRSLAVSPSSADESAAIDGHGALVCGVCRRASSSKPSVGSGFFRRRSSSLVSPRACLCRTLPSTNRCLCEFTASRARAAAIAARCAALVTKQHISTASLSSSSSAAPAVRERRPLLSHSAFWSVDQCHHHHHNPRDHRGCLAYGGRDVDKELNSLLLRRPVDISRHAVGSGQLPAEEMSEQTSSAAEIFRSDVPSGMTTIHVEVPQEDSENAEVIRPPNGSSSGQVVQEEQKRRAVKGQQRKATAGTDGKRRRGRKKKQEEGSGVGGEKNANDLFGSTKNGRKRERVVLSAEVGERGGVEAVISEPTDSSGKGGSSVGEMERTDERGGDKWMERTADEDGESASASASASHGGGPIVDGAEEGEKDSGTASGEEGEQSSSQNDEDEDEDNVMIGNMKMSVVCDRLMDVFLKEKTNPDEWRKLLAFSDEWQNIRPHFYKRCKVRAAQEENIEFKTSYLRLARRLEKVDQDMQRHDELLRTIEENEKELDALVLRRRKDFTSDFFKHMKLVAETYYDDLTKQDEMTSLATKVLSAVENHDRMQQDQSAMAEAQEKFDNILNSPNLEVAKAKIDNLAANKQLDPALMMLITKAWVAAKESNMMKEEVKDIMHHLYMQARGNLQRFLPTEVRILRHLLSIEDPRERTAALTEAFSPGDELEGEKMDMLYTTPQRLYRYVSAVLGAYEHPRNNPVFQAAKDMMKPMVIQRLMILKELLEDEFL